MDKNVLTSLIIIVVIGVGAYFVIKNAPEKKPAEQNVTQQINMDTSEDAPQMVILKEGEGEDVVKSGDTLGVLYTGYLQDGKVFDSNVESGQVFEFQVGAGQVISGWEIGLIGMKIGEVRKLILPPSFAYGSNAVGSIPANSTLVFDVELKSIK